MAAALTAPGAAHAVENLPPRQPLVQDLQAGTRPCAAGEDRPYVASPPTLSAVLYDPEEDNQPAEANLVHGEFEAWWQDADGAEQRLTYSTRTTLSGTRQQWRLPQDIPANTPISWRVRANDGTAVSAWSSQGDGITCEFVYDDVSPDKPVVTSPDYPEDEIRDGVGVWGGFTMDSPSDDVVEYRYNFIGGPYLTARPDEPGGPATIRHLPTRPAPDYLSVRAIDRAGRSSATTTYWFRVKSGRAPVAHWTLGDAAGSATAEAESGPDARAGAGVTFGASAPRGTSLASAVRLDGGGHGYLTPDVPAVDTRGTYAVSAWARPAETDRGMTVVSQDAGPSAGFSLDLHTSGDGPRWSFAVGGTRISGGAPETGEWAHLLGLYDVETGLARLYVNGREVGTAARATPADTSDGAFQIGRVRKDDGYRGRWHGELGDVRAYDRVAVPDEVNELAYRKPTLLGHWSLEDAPGGVSPEQSGRAPLTLGPGATIHRVPDGSCTPDFDPDCPAVPYPLVGDGHLRLDGENGYASTDSAVVDTTNSFTLGVVVRLADSAPTRPMTVLSQPGKHTDVFKVRYDPSVHSWQLVMPQKDRADAPEVVVSQIHAPDGGEGPGHRLAVVYDDAADRIKLYLDGHTNDGATASFPGSPPSSGALQIGRSMTGDGWGEYLHGDVDEVQAYAGALRDTDIFGLGWGTAPCLC
ncbi:LamG domain-containing protein [Streptomyces radiopugnans]|uniref:Concanavalin A-like lectin/glucanases superfamily protein n=1 Tax=Streptomyces radiopugnans TaxID=403935 RepID=A0A1H9JTX4_9ACTN|nr:LamG domain-containing protein [Streptomyces radiopugnans]SEQ90258.1 Concanavalin A-like lectin/glucanases superfamily protein [Streptomyces radiopugnans]